MLFARRPSPPVRRWVLAGYWTLIYFLTHWPDMGRFRMPSGWLSSNADKLVHASFYAGWVVLWWWVLAAGRGRVSRAAAIWLAVGAAAYAAFDELTQAIVGRQPDILDFAFDMLGVLLALSVLWLWQRRRLAAQAARPGAPKPARAATRSTRLSA